MTAVDKIDVGNRLQQIINTYWYGSVSPATFMGASNVSSPRVRNGTTQKLAVPVKGQQIVRQQIYICNFGWLFVFFLASTIMASSAILGLYLSIRTCGPDILGYFSTNLRDSPYVLHSLEESAMDRVTRSRKYAEMKIRLVDVEGEENHGYIAIAEHLWRHN